MYFFTVTYSNEQLTPETGAVMSLRVHVKDSACVFLPDRDKNLLKGLVSLSLQI